MKICQKCHKKFDDSLAFCPYCGEKLEEEIKQDVVDNNGYTEEQLKRYREQLNSFRRSRTNFTIAGAILLGLSIFGIILGAILIATNASSIEYAGSIAAVVLGSISLAFGFIFLPFGIAFLVVASAVFSRRIENRERILKDY